MRKARAHTQGPLANAHDSNASQVYDITEHIALHPGWDGAGVTTVLSILAHAGTDCSEEFEAIHRPWPAAWRQLAVFDIGPLADEE